MKGLGTCFGGCLDVANGSLTPALLESLQILGLFYDKIVVPDVFFHGRGPIYNHVAERVNFNSDEINEDYILRFLKEGVLVPSQREGNNISVTENYLSDRVEKGTFLIPSKEEGLKVMEFYDYLVEEKAETIWTREMSRKTFCAMKELYLTPKEDVLYEKLERELDLNTEDDSWKKHLDSWKNAISIQEKQEFFRRGELEEVLANILEVPQCSVYEKILNNRTTDIPREYRKRINDYKLAYYLCKDLVVYYQITQGTQLADTASVSPYLQESNIDLGLLNNSVGIPDEFMSHDWKPWNCKLNTKAFWGMPTSAYFELRNRFFKEYAKGIISFGDDQDKLKMFTLDIAKELKPSITPWLINLLYATGYFSKNTVSDYIGEPIMETVIMVARAPIKKGIEKLCVRRKQKKIGKSFNNFSKLTFKIGEKVN
jgi:hypothetical protein